MVLKCLLGGEKNGEYGIMDKGMSKQTKKVNIFNQEKRRVLCIANEHDYLGDGTIFHEEELQVGKQYTFIKGEARAYGLMVHLDELPRECGYHSHLFEELQPYDAKTLEREYNNWIKEKLDESEKAMKEGRMRYCSLEEFKASRKARKNRHFYITGDCHGDFKKIDFFANITTPARMMS